MYCNQSYTLTEERKSFVEREQKIYEMIMSHRKDIANTIEQLYQQSLHKNKPITKFSINQKVINPIYGYN